jgi:hypothetical protein
MPTRRELDFRNLDDVVKDMESLRAGGYFQIGGWDLVQVCGHLAEWMRFPLDGFPKPLVPIRLMLWSMRLTVGPRLLRKTLQARSMPIGRQTFPETVPPPGGDEAAAVQRFCQLVTRFQAHDGRYHPSPLFGAMDRETLTQLQLIHCSHHLSFLMPREQPPS